MSRLGDTIRAARVKAKMTEKALSMKFGNSNVRLTNSAIGGTTSAYTERRLDEVRRLLVSTREKIDNIAAACGYESPNYLKNLFKKRFGCSMRDYRNLSSNGLECLSV